MKKHNPESERLMCANECWCNPRPALGECSFCLHKEISDQDERIQHLKDALKDMSMALDFYAETSDDWKDRYGDIGGKQAREALQKHKELLSKINEERK